jgi:hypothetical protein
MQQMHHVTQNVVVHGLDLILAVTAYASVVLKMMNAVNVVVVAFQKAIVIAMAI